MNGSGGVPWLGGIRHPASGQRDGRRRKSEAAVATPRWLPHALVVLAATLLGVNYALAIFSFGDTGLERQLSDLSYRVLIFGASFACIAHAVLKPADRLGWSLIGGGLVAWAVGDLGWSTGGAPLFGVTWLTDILFFGFYVAVLLGLRVLAGRGDGEGVVSLPILIAILGIGTLWVALVFGPLASVSAIDLGYAVLGLGLAVAVAMVWAARGFRREWWLFALLAGTLVTALADGLFALQVGTGSYQEATFLDSLWPTGALLIAAAPWLHQHDGRTGSTGADRAQVGPLALSVASTCLAVVVLVWDHFERFSTGSVILAAVTLLASTAHLVFLHHGRGRAQDDARRAAAVSTHALGVLVDIKDARGWHDSDRIGEICAEVGRRAGLTEACAERLRLAGRLHDVGKISVPAHILKKPTRLTAEEYERVKRHPMDGARIVEAIAGSDVAKWILHHHERWDGDGYPSRLAGVAIPLESRIVGIADALEAMTGDRPYRRKLSVGEAIAELRRCAGTQFDPRVVELMVAELTERELSGRETGAW